MVRFEHGQGVVWKHPVSRFSQYGIVMRCDDEFVYVAPVHVLMPNVKCYDDGGAKFDRDRDNVHLKGCPPPFTEFYEKIRMDGFSRAYVYADVDNPRPVPISGMNGAMLVDGGIKVSEPMMEEIRNHPWTGHPELERNRVPRADRGLLAEDFFDIGQPSDMPASGPDFSG